MNSVYEEAVEFANKFLEEFNISMTNIQKSNFVEELVKFRVSAQQSVQRIGGTPCPECNKLGGSHLWSCSIGNSANR